VTKNNITAPKELLESQSKKSSKDKPTGVIEEYRVKLAKLQQDL
jgi:hypothetical protein